MAKHCDFCFRVAIFLTFVVYLVEGKYLLYISRLTGQPLFMFLRERQMDTNYIDLDTNSPCWALVQ